VRAAFVAAKSKERKDFCALASPARPAVFFTGNQIELRQRLPVAIMLTP
jgi:hypothetical protein